MGSCEGGDEVADCVGAEAYDTREQQGVPCSHSVMSGSARQYVCIFRLCDDFTWTWFWARASVKQRC